MRLRTGRFPKTFRTCWPISSDISQCWLLYYQRQHSSNPVGYEILSCTDSSLIFRFKPSPCPIHYNGRWATMPSADFCLIACRVNPSCAIGFHLVRSFQSMKLKSQGTYKPESYWLMTDHVLNRSHQIRT